MNSIQIIAGAIAGVIGAAIWAAVAYFANLEIGYIAWGIGGLVGVAVAAAGKNSTLAGVAAVLITVVSIVAGKYAVVELAMGEVQTEIDNMAAQWDNQANDLNDEDLISILANQIAEQREADGQPVKWPEVSDDEESLEASYPTDIWKDAKTQFAAKSDADKTSLRETYEENVKQQIQAIKDMIADEARTQGFLGSFGALDLLFFGLAVATAWGIASKDEEAP